MRTRFGLDLRWREFYEMYRYCGIKVRFVTLIPDLMKCFVLGGGEPGVRWARDGLWSFAVIVLLLSGSQRSFGSDGVASLREWRNLHFNDPDGLGTGNDRADPDGDGIRNLVEYALALDPNRISLAGLPTVSVSGTHLQLHYQRARSDVDYVVEVSPDLVSWSRSGVDQGAGLLGETIASVPLTGGIKMLRLRIDGGPTYVPLYHAETTLEPATTVETGEALHTYFSDRARDRHAREDQYEAYDHYLGFYWEDRTVAVEIVDTIPMGGDTITFRVTSQWKLKQEQAELRFFYRGIGTVAEYFDNKSMTPLDDTHYVRTVSYNPKEGRPLRVGDRMEFELSQFLESPPNGRDNYYGTTYLYIVGKGLVPWESRGVFGDFSTEMEDSFPIPEEGWLGGGTTLPYAYSGEDDGHFMQMATNLSYGNGQVFVRGRRVHHTDFGDGSHDEGTENPPFRELAGFLGERYVNRSCVACHERNGRGLPPSQGGALSQYVVRVGDGDGNAHPMLGHVLQSRAVDGDPEASVFLEEWIPSGNLRMPVYRFEGVEPAHFSVRIAPQLVGMGLLEAIPEVSLEALADPEDLDGDGISGRLRRVVDSKTGEVRVGRFGWKASQPTVRSQVASALNADIGVMTSLLPDPDHGSAQAGSSLPGVELDDRHLDDLSTYLSLLGVRPQKNLDDTEVIRGKTLFGRIGCEDCHTPEFQTSAFHPHAELRNQTIRPYTDLLIHDMGPGLADTLNSDRVGNSEWRTAPLWGIGRTVGVSGGEAYLHDGRARSLEEAILWHAGEAENSRREYEVLAAEDREAVIEFLQSL